MRFLINSLRKSLVAIFFILPVIAFAQIETTVFIQKDSVYKFSYPSSWKTMKTYEADLHLRIPKVEGQIRCELLSKTQKITGDFDKASIKEIALEEERLTKTELQKSLLPGNTITYQQSLFDKIHGKEWWIFKYTGNYTGFKFHVLVFKTTHNNKVYSIEFRASDNNYANHYEQVISIINSYTFFAKDETVYRKTSVSDKTTASSSSQGGSGASGTSVNFDKKENNGTAAQPGTVITSIPSSTATTNNEAVVAPEEPTQKTEEELIAEEKKKETDLIKSCASTTVKRKSSELLEVKLGNGKTILLKNKDAGEDTENYRFIDCFPSFNAYLFRVGGWEEETWLLLNKTDGTKTWLASGPILSPDKKRLICTLSGENEVGYDANYLAIWIFVNGKPKKEFELTNMNWGAGVAEWLSNTSIKVEAEKYDGTDTKQLKPKTITLLNGKWVVK